MKKYILILWLTMCLGCSSSSRKEIVTIILIDSGQALKVSGIDNDILQEINRDSVSSWQSLIPVYRMPTDTDMKDYQHAQSGKYSVSGNAVIFMPDTPFAKQQTYFVRWFHYDKGNKPADYIKSEKKLGRIPFSDLIFKR
jgi:hypothetical protein